jgi:hypothetical protein
MTARSLLLTTTAAAAVWMATIPPAGAALITYTEETIGSGTLDGQAFTDADVLLTASGNTSNITHPIPNLIRNALVAGTVTVAGIGTDTFTGPIEVEQQNDVAVAILQAGVGFILGTSTSDHAFAGYGLATSFGPIDGDSLLNPGHAFATSSGAFTLSSTDRTATFDASAVPEPVSAVLLVTGLIAVASRRSNLRRS